MNDPESAAPEERAAEAARTSIADGREKTLDPQALILWRIGGSIAAAVITLATLIALLVLMLSVFQGIWRMVAPVGWLLGALLLWLHAIFWPGLRYRHYRYRVLADSLEIRRGVIWRSWIHVPRSRVQHTDVSRGPLERVFELATLVVYTAGTEHASIHLSGLAAPDAVRLRDHLIPQSSEDAV